MPYDEFNKIDEEYFDTVLEEDFFFEGDITLESSLIVKGSIKGKIESGGLLIVGPNSVIEANVKAKNLQCFGKIIGNVAVKEEAYFHNPSQLTGDLSVPVLTLEKGCTLNGKVHMVTSMKQEENYAKKN